jgi:D-3-phosphoglycerate dehydrogenase
MRILFLPFNPVMHYWYDGFVEAVDGRYPIEMYDPDKPLAPQFEGIDVVVACAGCTHEMVDASVAAGVKLWQVLSVGVDHWDMPYFFRKEMPFANTPGPFSAIALAEHALTLMLVIAKNHRVAQANVRTETFSLPLNDELAGKKLGLIGLGASGRELAKRGHAMGMEILAIDVADIPQSVRDEHHVSFFGGASELARVIAEADYLSLHTPSTAETRHMIGRQQFEMMKPSAVLINVARGLLVDEDALVEALKSGQIRGAGVDAFANEPLSSSHPLLQMDNVYCTPHVAGVTRETAQRRGQAAANNVERVSQGLEPLHLVTSVD